MLTKRSRILGLPIGPKKVDWQKIVALTTGALAVARGIMGLLNSGEKIGRLIDRLPTGQAKETLEEGEEFLEEGEEALQEVSGIASKIGNVVQAVSGASGFFGKIKAGLQALGIGGGGGDKSKKLRLHIKLAQDVGVPRSVAYNQWTQLEDLPQFMKGVESVEIEGDEEDPGNITNSNWTVKIGFSRRQFSAEVTEAVPDERIAWESTEGPQHEGVVSFATLDDEHDNLTRVQVQMLYVPSGFVEKVGNIFLAARRKARKDLRLYKHHMELTGEETGAWRGEITPDEEDDGDADEATDDVEG